MKAITNLIYSALALFAFAGFAVTANAEIVKGKEISRNNWEIATLFKDMATCAGGAFTVGGKLKVEFEVHRRPDGREVVEPKTDEMNGAKFLPKDASNSVGAEAGPITFRVDRVEVSDLSFPGNGGGMKMTIFFVSTNNPRNTLTFRAVYKKIGRAHV